MNRQTDGFFGVNEALFSSALAAFVFSLFSSQPITIVGITGLISLFNYTIFDIVSKYDVTLYPRVLAWTGIWAAIFHWLFAIFNTCDYMRYVTDFSSQSFAMYVGIIYCSMCPIIYPLNCLVVSNRKIQYERACSHFCIQSRALKSLSHYLTLAM